MAKRHRKGHRRGKRGFGSIITVRRGMGKIPGGAMGAAILPGLVGALVTGLTAIGIRWFVDPARGTTQQFLVRWSWLFGHAAGVLSSAAFFMLGGTPAAASSFIAATGVGLTLFGQDLVLKQRGGSVLATLQTSSASLAPDAGASAGTEGLGAIVPEYPRPRMGAGMGAIVMESVGPSGKRAGTIGSYGETVTLQGINTRAFGTPGFSA